MNDGINQVHEQVWISNITAARTHGMDEFDAVVTVCQDSIEDHIPEGVHYHFFEMADGPHCGYGGRHDYEYFEYAARTILEHLRNGDNILVHCHAGQSRSASTTIAALGVYRDATYHEVYSNVESQRPQIHPDDLLRQHAMRFIEEHTDINHEPFSDNS